MTYRKLSATARKLASMSNDETSNDQYHALADQFKQDLKTFFKDKTALAKMNKAQLIKFIGWCSSRRPFAPHVILMYLADIK